MKKKKFLAYHRLGVAVISTLLELCVQFEFFFFFFVNALRKENRYNVQGHTHTFDAGTIPNEIRALEIIVMCES